MSCARVFGLVVVCCLLSSTPLLADVAPPEPNIARNPVLAGHRQSAVVGTIALALLLTAAISMGGIVVSRNWPRRGVGVVAAVVAALVWLGAMTFAWTDWHRAHREQEELTKQAEREWADWEVRRAQRRRNWVGPQPSLRIRPELPREPENKTPPVNAP